MSELRKIVRLTGEVVSMSELKEGDTFSMYEPDGKFLGSYKALFDAEGGSVEATSIPTTTASESPTWALGAVYRTEP